jgi:hypothetical protein
MKTKTHIQLADFAQNRAVRHKEGLDDNRDHVLLCTEDNSKSARQQQCECLRISGPAKRTAAGQSTEGRLVHLKVLQERRHIKVRIDLEQLRAREPQQATR